MSRTLFGGSMFQQESFVPRRLGMTFSDLRAQWDQYAPTVRTDLKAVRDELAPTPTAPATLTSPAAPRITSPTNLVPGPALQGTSGTSLVLILSGLAAAGIGAWYFFFKNKKK